MADLVAAGSWGEFDLVKYGQPQPEYMALLPLTTRLIFSRSEALTMVRGGTKVSIMAPGTQISSHSGLSNTRLRIHLGIDVPDGCGIMVDGEVRTWAEGE